MGVHGGRWEWSGEGRWMWREEWRERQKKEVGQVKRMCEDKLQAIVRENEATAQMVKIKHELENMAREEKELEVMYLEEVKEMEPERRKEIYLEEVKEMDEGPWVWRHV